jgi:hypothetical protein
MKYVRGNVDIGGAGILWTPYEDSEGGSRTGPTA